MKIYNYNKTTGELLNESIATIDPVETKIQGKDIYLIPANGTMIKPPITEEKEIAVFDGEKWDIKADYRNENVFNKTNREEQTVSHIGEIDDNYTNVAPQNQYQIWSDENNDWVIDETQRDELIRLNCDKINKGTKNKITNDFVFNEINFKLTAENQRNYDNECRMRAGLIYPYKVKTVDDYYEFANAEEYQQFYLAIIAYIRTCLEAGWDQKDSLNQLSTEQLIKKLEE